MAEVFPEPQRQVVNVESVDVARSLPVQLERANAFRLCQFAVVLPALGASNFRDLARGHGR